jgi:peptidoglycan/xylan/chitin deacetylase (PgdA/CDA1 family)
MFKYTIPHLLRWIYPNYTWKVKTSEKVVYFTFDDGPHPEITTWVLEQLAIYNAKATFFMVGDNMAKYPQVVRQVQIAGCKIGNHTFNHLKGWKTANEMYLDNFRKSEAVLKTELFRPPYGRITRFQQSCLKQPRYQLKTIMWSVLSGDFDQSITKEKCLKNVLYSTKKGSIVVFHDSEKAWDRLQESLPQVLAHFSGMGYLFKIL